MIFSAVIPLSLADQIVRSSRALLVGWLVISVGSAGVRGEEGEAVRVFLLVQHSAVSLRNVEGNGSGIIVDPSGLIFTNAHFVSSHFLIKSM